MELKNHHLEEEQVSYLSAIFKMLADPNRLRIFHALLQQPMSVEALTDHLGLSQSNVSHQLKALREIMLVKFEKQGKYSIYSLADKHVEQIYLQALEHVLEDLQ